MKTVGLMVGGARGNGMGMVEGVFYRGLPFGIRRFKPILPFLGGRSDVACRVVMKTVGLHGWKVRRAWDGHGGVVGGGIFALRRPRPYSRRLRGCPCASHCDPDVAIAAAMRVPCRPWKPTFYNRGGMGRAGAFGGLRVRGGGRATFGPPLQHRPYPERNRKSRQWVEIFIALRRCKTNA